jgi:16S rRNA (guanine966-N2)-methyltransferase|tara:strand:- start:166 stop:789 length:624 start_codon:yes stop_codon:yes gene_type:complete
VGIEVTKSPEKIVHEEKVVRIVGGRLKGRALMSPANEHLRPTADRVKESIFNILLHGIDGFNIENIAVIDVFCGTGALGLEAISRGARHSIFIDHNNGAIEIARQNALSMGLKDEVTILKLEMQTLAQPPKKVRLPAKLAFLDPPYNKGLASMALSVLKNKGWLEHDALCVVETSVKEMLDIPKDFNFLNERIYGPTRIIFFRYNRQ